MNNYLRIYSLSLVFLVLVGEYSSVYATEPTDRWLSIPRFKSGMLAALDSAVFSFSEPSGLLQRWVVGGRYQRESVLPDSLRLLVDDFYATRIIGNGKQTLLIAGTDNLHRTNGTLLRSYDAGATWLSERPLGMDSHSFPTGVILDDAFQFLNDTTVLLHRMISHDGGRSFNPITLLNGDTLRYSTYQTSIVSHDGSLLILDYRAKKVYTLEPNSTTIATEISVKDMPSFARGLDRDRLICLFGGAYLFVVDKDLSTTTEIRWSASDTEHDAARIAAKQIHTTPNFTIINVPSQSIMAVFSKDSFNIVRYDSASTRSVTAFELHDTLNFIVNTLNRGSRLYTFDGVRLHEMGTRLWEHHLTGNSAIKGAVCNGTFCFIDESGALFYVNESEGIIRLTSEEPNEMSMIIGVTPFKDGVIFQDVHTDLYYSSDAIHALPVARNIGQRTTYNVDYRDMSSYLEEMSCKVQSRFHHPSIMDTVLLSSMRGALSISDQILINADYQGRSTDKNARYVLTSEGTDLTFNNLSTGESRQYRTDSQVFPHAVHIAGSTALLEYGCRQVECNAGIESFNMDDNVIATKRFFREWTTHSISTDSSGALWAVLSDARIKAGCDSSGTDLIETMPGRQLLICVSLDQGKTWNCIDTLQLSGAIKPLSGSVAGWRDYRFMALGDVIGVYHKQANGSYKPIGYEMPGSLLLTYYDVAVNADRLFAGTSHGLYVSKVADVVTSVDVSTTSDLQRNLIVSLKQKDDFLVVQIEQSNSIASIPLTVTLSDITGRVIRSVPYTENESGLYECSFDLVNCSSGLYFLTVSSQQERHTQKVIVHGR